MQGTVSVMIRRTWRKTGLPWWLRWWSICLPMQETLVPSLGCEDPLEKGMAIHSSILAWRIPWTEEPGRLQSMESQRAGHDWVTEHEGKEGLVVSKKKKVIISIQKIITAFSSREFIYPVPSSFVFSFLRKVNVLSLPKPLFNFITWQLRTKQSNDLQSTLIFRWGVLCMD